MSKRKQRHNPISYTEQPPLWKLLATKTKEEEERQHGLKKHKKEEPSYEEMISAEAEEAEHIENVTIIEQISEAEEVVQGFDKERTREFIQKEMQKLLVTLDDLVDYDDHAYVVNFVLEMSGQAKKKLRELQGVTTTIIWIKYRIIFLLHT